MVDLGGGNFEYQLLGTGEPHGTIRFLGAFDTVSWRSLSNEFWNGFTVGIEDTAQEILLGDITGIKFEDLNQIGIRDVGEGVLEGWAIELFDAAGNLVGTETTAADGTYNFVDVPLGTYTVREILQNDWIQTAGSGSIDIVVGQAVVMDFGNFFDSSQPPPPGPVPVPAPLALLALGVLGLRRPAPAG